MPFEYLDPPQLRILSETEGREERRVSNWITEWDFEAGEIDCIKDVRDVTSRLAVNIIMSFLTGFYEKKQTYA